MTTDWHIYKGGREPHPPTELQDTWLSFEKCPPWRRPHREWEDRLDGVGVVQWNFDDPDEGAHRAKSRAVNYVTTGIRSDTQGSPSEIDQVNLALLLRRPLLVRGTPGIGKSSLAYNIAWCLGLGRPFRWEISSTTTLQDGLYSYDAVGHFHKGKEQPLHKFIRLGPLGTVLAPTAHPTCLLIDELDKSSYDLPNDLLHAFEEGAFRIPEIEETDTVSPDSESVIPPKVPPKVKSLDGREVPVLGGIVRCHHHPVVVITTNGEREFPPAFMRRCVELPLRTPEADQLLLIVQRWFGGSEGLDNILRELEGRPTDSILQALFMTQKHGADLSAVTRGLSEGRTE